jgi:hypothetical protein
VEEVLVGIFKGKTIEDSIPSIGGGSPTGVFFVAIILAVALIPFFALREIGRVIGERELHSVIFTDGQKLRHFSPKCGKEVANPSYSSHIRDSLAGMVQPSGIV